MTGEYLNALVDSWRTFDWRTREHWLNAHPQFLAEIGDTTVHFAHLRSARADAPVMLVMHGWPHTFALQLDFADLLPDFHVVVPSLPGFAFSTAYAEGPVTEVRLAATMHALMTEVLGYETVPHLRRGRLGERQRPPRGCLSRCRAGHHRDARALPIRA
jgi:pimeloyl-ACP methyl ester carboxylesterase